MKKIWDKLTGALGIEDEGEEHAADDASYAAAALLLEMTEADLEVDAEERTAVRKALRDTFGLSAREIERLMQRASDELDREVSYYPHVETINAVCGPEEKETIVEQMWRVAFADGDLDKYEEHYLRKLCSLLHVPHQTFIRARHRVEEDLSSGDDKSL